MEEKYLLMCGSCKYRLNNVCQNRNSECYKDIVDKSCDCDFYLPKSDICRKLSEGYYGRK